MANTKDKSKPRYDNIDPNGWVVRTSDGKQPISETFTNFSTANDAARRLMEQSTEYVYASAVRK